MAWKNWGDHPVVVALGLIIALAGLVVGLVGLNRPDQKEPTESRRAADPPPIDGRLLGVWFTDDHKEQTLTAPDGHSARRTIVSQDRFALSRDGSYSINSDAVMTEIDQGSTFEQRCRAASTGRWQQDGQIVRVTLDDTKVSVVSIVRNGQWLDPATVPAGLRCDSVAVPKGFTVESEIKAIHDDSVEILSKETGELGTWTRKRGPSLVQ